MTSLRNSFIINKSYFILILLYDVMLLKKLHSYTPQEQARARYETRRLGIKSGPCEICGTEPADLHHIDYSNPRRVMRLCHKHHMQTHSQFAKPAPIDWMADIRAATKAIEAARLASRANKLDFLASPPKSVELPRDKARALRCTVSERSREGKASVTTRERSNDGKRKGQVRRGKAVR